MAFEPEIKKTTTLPNNIKDAKTSINNPSLSDLKIIDLIMYAMEDAYCKSQVLNGLSQKFSNKKDKETIYNMYLDRLKHYKLLQEVYFKSAGRLPRTLAFEEYIYSPQLYEELENVFNDTKKTIHTLKKLLFAFVAIAQRDIFYEIIFDLEAHLSEIAMLFTKYR